MTTSAVPMIVMSRPSSLPDIQTAMLPPAYERAKGALAACERIDECKDWADKAAALASYAKQADDQTLHRLATRISSRAIHRCGELLEQFNKGVGAPKKNGAGAHPITQRQAAASAGMSEHQEKQAVRVANVPVEDFEATVESDDPPTVTKLAELGKTSRPRPEPPPGFADATHTIGVLEEFATFCATHPPALVVDALYPHELAPVIESITAVQAWLAAFLSERRIRRVHPGHK